MKEWFLFFFLFATCLFAEEKKGVYLPGNFESDSYISGDGFKELCDFVFEKGETFDPTLVQEGSVIFVDLEVLPLFFSQMHPQIPHRYILLTHNGNISCSTPGSYFLFLEDEKILAWFGSQMNVRHSKLFPIPIGLASSLWRSGNIKFFFDIIRNNRIEKKHLLYLNFSLKNAPLFRWEAYHALINQSFCVSSLDNDWGAYVEGISESKFVVCPRGEGEDNCRIWEVLVLGSIPIVKSSFLDPLYENLPVVIVHDWAEITQEFLEKKYQEMSKKVFCYKKLFLSYWDKKIKEKKGL